MVGCAETWVGFAALLLLAGCFSVGPPPLMRLVASIGRYNCQSCCLFLLATRWRLLAMGPMQEVVSKSSEGARTLDTEEKIRLAVVIETCRACSFPPLHRYRV